MTLQQFIDNYVQLSYFRGIDPKNPIDFVIQPDANVRKTWVLIVSHSEPTFARVPYNVLWIPLDSNDPNFGKVIRRTDHQVPLSPYRSTWEEVADYESLWDPEQFYAPVIEDLALYGISSPNENIPSATTTITGITKLASNPMNGDAPVDPVEAIAINTHDPRMSDDRYPNEHDHPDYARSLIKINSTQWARVDKSFPPEPGMSLFLDAVNPANPNEYVAVWRFPTEDSIVLVDRSLLYIEIRGDTSILEQDSKHYEVWGVFADGESRIVHPNTWDITQNGFAASIMHYEGVGTMLAENIIENVTVRQSASYTEDDITRTAFLDIQIIAAADLETLQIVGPGTVASGSSTQYQVLAGFSDGSFVNVTPSAMNSTNAETSIDTTKILVVQTVYTNQNTTLEAAYTFGGITLNATLPVAITKAADVPTALRIIGASSIDERTSQVYTFEVDYASGDTVTKTSVNSFTKQSGPAALTVSASTATLGSTTANASAVLAASYTESGVTVTDTHPLDIVDADLPAAMVVKADTSVFADTMAWLRLESNTEIDPTTFEPATDLVWSFGAATYMGMQLPHDNQKVDFDTDITATAAQYKARWPYKRAIPLTASKTIARLANATLSATRTIYVNPPKLVGLKLVPVGQNAATYVMPTDFTTLSFNENTTIGVEVWFQIESPTNPVTTEWIKHQPEAAPASDPAWGGMNYTFREFTTSPGINTTVDTSMLNGNLLSTLGGTITVGSANVASDTQSYIRLNVKHSPSANSAADASVVDLTAELRFTVTNVLPTVTGFRIRLAGGPDANASSHNEDSVLQVRYEAEFSDNPSVWEDVTNYPGLVSSLRNPAWGSVLDQPTKVLTLGSVTGNQTVAITASLTFNGNTVAASSYQITILDTTPYINTLRVRLSKAPSQAGNSSSENEDQTLGLKYFVDYTNAIGTFVEVNPDTVGAALVVNLSTANGATLAPDKKSITLPNVTGNKDAVISATYTENSVTKAGNYTITMLDLTVYLNSIRVRLAKAPNAAASSSTETESQSLGLVYQADYSNAIGTWVTIDPANAGLTVALANNTANATLAGDKTAVTLGDVVGQQSVRVDATFLENGVTKTGSYTITVTDQTIYLNAFRIRLSTAPNAATNQSTHSENQTLGIVYQAQYSNNPTVWVDVSSDSGVTGAVVAPANGVTMPSKTQVALPDVSANTQVTVRGTYNYNGSPTTADYIFDITNVVVTPLELRIRLASNPSAGTNASTHNELTNVTMIYQARLSDNVGVWVNVNTNPGLSAAVQAPTNGVTLSGDKLTASLPDVSGDKTTTLTASLTMNGTTVNATYVFTITDMNAPTGISARWGVAPRQALQADYATPAFYDLLTNPLTLVNGELIGPVVGNGSFNALGYILYPKTKGFLYIVSTTGQAGAWDGGRTTTDDGTLGSPAEVTINGIQYYIYRQSFPVNGSRSYNITYGSSAEGSGTP